MKKSQYLVAGIIAVAAVLVIALVINKPSENYSYEAKTFTSLEEMQNFMQQNSEVEGSISKTTAVAPASAESAGGQERADSGTSASTSQSAYSRTNVQVEGIDEPDIIKTDGEYIYAVSYSNVSIIKAYPAEQMNVVSILSYNGYVSNIFINSNSNSLVVFGQENQNIEPVPYQIEPATAMEKRIASGSDAAIAPYYYNQKSFIRIYDISDKNSPKLEKEIMYDGSLYDSRMVGDIVYAITNQPLEYGNNLVLPEVTDDGESTEIKANEIAYFDYPDTNYQLTIILGIDLNNLQLEKSSFMTGYTQTIYASDKNIYLTSTKYAPYSLYQERYYEDVLLPSLPLSQRSEVENILEKDIDTYEKQLEIEEVLADYYNSLSQEEKNEFGEEISDRMAELNDFLSKEYQKTIVHRIEINNGKAEYKAKGEVPGYLLNQFSLDEHNGNLRLATTTQPSWFGGPIFFGSVREGSSPGFEGIATDSTLTSDSEDSTAQATEEGEVENRNVQKNHVYVLNENLEITGRLENLAQTETIYSARFIEDRFYLVTFRHVDPLFVIDLSGRNPEVLGKLKIPGYSTYLHPYDENHIIGFGVDTTEAARAEGLKIALFDVSDVENPEEIAKTTIGDRGTSSEALYNHKAFLFDKEKSLLVLPVSVYESDSGNQWGYGKIAFSGAYVYSLTPESGFNLKGTITHLNAAEQSNLTKASEYYWYYPPYDAQIQRSLYINDALYTMSQRELRANNIDTISEINSVSLPNQPQYYYAYAA